MLVVAPHCDDEILGCGGLLAQLAAGGAEIAVLYLSDSAGVDPDPAVRAQLAETRRAEAARGLAALGLEAPTVEWAGLPDGALEHHDVELRAAVERSLRATRPELLLAPSPLEVSADHRAAFRAVFDALAPLGWEDPPDRLLEGLTVLLYEVNHPAYVDVLVDVTAEVERIESAMRCHASQLAEHDYLGAALAIRRFRTLTLEAGTPDAGVGSAEGYVRLASRDLSTFSLAQLVAELGGRAHPREVREGPLVSVVVRTRDRPRLLDEALASVAASTYRRVEVVLVNDGGTPPAPPPGFPFPLRRVELPERRGPAAAGNAGLRAAEGEYVVFLDDDDLLAPEHLAHLLPVIEPLDGTVVYGETAVATYEARDGEGWVCTDRRVSFHRDFDPDLLRVDNFIPLHSLLARRRLLDELGGFDESLPVLEDWDLLIRLSERVPFQSVPGVTSEYRRFATAGHHALGPQAELQPDYQEARARILARHADGIDPERLSRIVARHLELEAERRRRRESEARLERVQGDLQVLRRDVERLTTRLDPGRGDAERVAAELEAIRSDLARARDGSAEGARASELELELVQERAERVKLQHHAHALFVELEATRTELASTRRELARKRDEADAERAERERLAARLAERGG